MFVTRKAPISHPRHSKTGFKPRTRSQPQSPHQRSQYSRNGRKDGDVALSYVFFRLITIFNEGNSGPHPVIRALLAPPKSKSSTTAPSPDSANSSRNPPTPSFTTLPQTRREAMLRHGGWRNLSCRVTIGVAATMGWIEKRVEVSVSHNVVGDIGGSTASRHERVVIAHRRSFHGRGWPHLLADHPPTSFVRHRQAFHRATTILLSSIRKEQTPHNHPPVVFAPHRVSLNVAWAGEGELDLNGMKAAGRGWRKETTVKGLAACPGACSDSVSLPSGSTPGSAGSSSDASSSLARGSVFVAASAIASRPARARVEGDPHQLASCHGRRVIRENGGQKVVLGLETFKSQYGLQRIKVWEDIVKSGDYKRDDSYVCSTSKNERITLHLESTLNNSYEDALRLDDEGRGAVHPTKNAGRTVVGVGERCMVWEGKATKDMVADGPNGLMLSKARDDIIIGEGLEAPVEVSGINLRNIELS
ncbi:hypothetical protein BDZ89DRAFT_1037108 [Hymenopellis radicata]|nr:hypothetical protein BDZ89DRAFT_1037108 [Hymenopellis radicata]